MIDPRAEVRTSRWTTASLALPMLMASMDTSIVNVALPTLSESFGATFAQVQWVVVGYLLSLTCLIIAVGRIGDMLGRRRLLLAGLVLFGTTSMACSFAPNLVVLIATRSLQGLGAAIVISMTLALVAEVVPPARIGRTMGFLGTMSAIGTALGPPVGGMFIDAVGWRAIFLLNVPLGVLAIWLVRRTGATEIRPETRGRRFDARGAVLLIAALGAYALAMTSGRFALLAVTAVALVLFIREERRAVAPLLELTLLRDRQLSTGLAASLLIATAIMTTLVVGPFYLAGALGLAPSSVGLVMATGPLAAALAGMLAGRVVDRFGSWRVVIVALCAVVTGLVALGQAPGIAGYVGSIVILTTGYAAFQAANNTSVMACAGISDRGLVSGLLSLSRNLGLITGAAAMGALFAASAGDVANAAPSAVAAGARMAFAAAAVLALAALLITTASTFAPKRTKLRPVVNPPSRRSNLPKRSAG